MKKVSSPIYLDYASTTPLLPEVIEAMQRCMGWEGCFGNAGSRSHAQGWQAEEHTESARQSVARALGCDVREIVFTSGATESNNLALKGIAQILREKGRHLITSEIEHKSVLDVMKFLESQGFQVTRLKPNAEGLITPEQLDEAIRPDTTLISIMWVNNEIGVIQPIEALGRLARERGVLFHTDASQALGKIPLSIDFVDLLSISAHKIYGPKGIGALYVRRKPKVRLMAQMHGGGQERGMRSGTLPVHQIVGFGHAIDWAVRHQAEEARRLRQLQSKLWQAISKMEGVSRNGSAVHTSPAILNVSFKGVEGESLMMALEPIALSSGSACTSTSLEPSYVLRALGLSDELAHSSLRFSFGHYTTEAEIEAVAAQLEGALSHLRALSPLWEMHQAGISETSITWAHP